MLVEWTVPDSHTLLWNINQQQKGTQDGQLRDFWIVIWRPEQVRGLGPWKRDDDDDNDNDNDDIQVIWEFENTNDISLSAEKKARIMKPRQSRGGPG